MKYKRLCFATFANTKKRIQKATGNGVFLTNFEVLGNVLGHCLEHLIYLLS